MGGGVKRAVDGRPKTSLFPPSSSSPPFYAPKKRDDGKFITSAFLHTPPPLPTYPKKMKVEREKKYKEEEEAQSYTYAKWDNSPFLPPSSKDVYFLQGKARNLHSSNQGKGEEEEEDG